MVQFKFTLNTSISLNDLLLPFDSALASNISGPTQVGDNYQYTIDLNQDQYGLVDGLKLYGWTHIGNLVSIDQYGTVPLSKNEEQFKGIGDNVTLPTDESDLPTILENTSFDSCFYNVTIPNSSFGNISYWNTSSVTSMDYMFLNCTNFNQPLNLWNTSSVTTMRSMFYQCINFNQQLNSWNTSSVTIMRTMFFRCTSFNQPLDLWNTSSVTNMRSMFYGCSSFNQPLNSWDTSSVTTMYSMFNGCTSFNQPLNSWDTSNVIYMLYMFKGCSSFNQSLDSWDTGKVIRMEVMFNGCTSFNQTSIANFDFTNVTNLSYFITNCNFDYNSYSTFLQLLSVNESLQPGLSLAYTGMIRLNDEATNTAYTILTEDKNLTIYDGGSYTASEIQDYINQNKAELKLSSSGGTTTLNTNTTLYYLSDSGGLFDPYPISINETYTIIVPKKYTLAIEGISDIESGYDLFTIKVDNVTTYNSDDDDNEIDLTIDNSLGTTSKTVLFTLTSDHDVHGTGIFINLTVNKVIDYSEPPDGEDLELNDINDIYNPSIQLQMYNYDVHFKKVRQKLSDGKNSYGPFRITWPCNYQNKYVYPLWEIMPNYIQNRAGFDAQKKRAINILSYNKNYFRR